MALCVTCQSYRGWHTRKFKKKKKKVKSVKLRLHHHFSEKFKNDNILMMCEKVIDRVEVLQGLCKLCKSSFSNACPMTNGDNR